jgi:hypothetical protein
MIQVNVEDTAKQKSSMNALTHGLTAKSPILPSEDQETYQLHLMSYSYEYSPKGPTETSMVESLADIAWRQKRILGLETSVIASDATLENQVKTLALMSLYATRLARQFEKTAKELRAFQQVRRAQEALDMEDLLNIRERKGPSYDPATHGFVFSDQEIAQALTLRSRKLHATGAVECINRPISD